MKMHFLQKSVETLASWSRSQILMQRLIATNAASRVGLKDDVEQGSTAESEMKTQEGSEELEKTNSKHESQQVDTKGQNGKVDQQNGMVG